MKITLLTGSFENERNICYSLEKVNDEYFIDYQLQNILKLRCEVDVVLGYQYSEEIMRSSRFLKQCNIVFDPNEKEGSRLSNLFAGLYSLYGEGFFLPIQYHSPSVEDWKKMINRLVPVSNFGYQLLRPYCPVNGEMKPGYPIGVTRDAKKMLMKNRKANSLEELALKEYKMPILDENLAHPYCSSRQNVPQVS